MRTWGEPRSLSSSFKALIHQTLTMQLGRKSKCPDPCLVLSCPVPQALLQSCLPGPPFIEMSLGATAELSPAPTIPIPQHHHPLPPPWERVNQQPERQGNKWLLSR